jgi:hypothetical protein
MANYIELATSRYPVSQSQIRSENPQTSYPASFPVPDGYALVFPAPAPTVPNPVIQIAREVTPVLTGKGNYEQTWEIVDIFSDYTDEEGVVHTKAEQEAAAIAAASATKIATFIKSVEVATQTRLDDFAKTKGYDGIISACSYATSDSKYGAEGRYCVSAREATWDALFQLMADVQAGTKPMPGSVEEVMETLPVLEWPVVV